jgi:uncharacterized membrane protein
MKKTHFLSLACFIIGILFSSDIGAQGYIIENYDVQIYLQKNGSIKVKETIDARFKEKKRGIIRAIPFRYSSESFVSGEIAQRSQTGGVYTTRIKDIQVDGHPFTTYEEGHEIKIRIGDPDVSFKGRVTYVISYTIWGTLNAFSENIEFPFNVIGQGWDVPIEEASFKVHFHTPITLKKEDFLAYTGGLGSKATNLTTTMDRQGVSGKLTRSLNEYEGISIALRFPKGYFDQTDIPITEYADQYWLKDHKVSYRLDEDGSVLVEELMKVGFTSRFQGLIRFSWATPEMLEAHGQRYYLEDLQLADAGTNIKVNAQWHRQDRAEELYANFTPGASERNLKMTYRLWGAVIQDTLLSGVYSVALPYTGIDGVSPIEKGEIKITQHPDVEANWSYWPEYLEMGGVWPKLQQEDKSISYGVTNPQLGGSSGSIILGLNRAYLALNAIPYQVFANYYVFKRIDQNLNVLTNGKVEVTQKMEIDLLDPAHAAYFHFPLPDKIAGFEVSDGSEIKFPDYNIFSKYTQIHMDDFEYDTSLFKIVRDDNFDRGLEFKDIAGNSRVVETTIKYTLSGFTRKESGNWVVNYPIIFHIPEPVLNTRFSITSENEEAVLSDWRIVNDKGNIIESSPAQSTGNFSHITGLSENVILSVTVPSDLINMSWFRHFALILENNTFLVIMFFIGLILFGLWWLIGRDKKVLLNVQYYPPEGMTPAEVGWLYDDKIDQRDLISLIFYWAANGYMIIEEIPDGKRKKKYRFIKLQSLPSSAQDFERTMFNGIFSKGSDVTTDDLKNTFYTKLKTAKSELEKHGKQKKFYLPGTRGFGTCLMILGVLVLIFSVVSFVIGFVLEDYSFGVAAIGTAILMFIFGRIMPKKGQLGHEKYEQLLGFKEFMDKAEADRLKKLLDEHPDYFSKTIAYAVAFGMAENWADKFSDLAIEPPDWYRSPDHGTFTAIYFASSLQNSMNSIGSVMSSMPASSGGSSFGGGFSGGGGFGGGGGSSW